MAPHLLTNRVTRHLLFWVGVILLAGSTYILEDISDSGSFSHRAGVVADLFLARLPTFVVYTYLLAYLVVPLLFRGQFVGFFAGLLLLYLTRWFLNDLLSYSLKFLLMHWWHEALPFQQNTWLFGSFLPGRNFFISNVIAGLFICGKLFLEWQQKQTEGQRFEREKLQTELHLLKLQLNPTFLFNTLDTLQPLIRQQAKQAPEVVLKLAHLLRYVLYESQADQVPLSGEIDVIDHYIFLQQAMHPTDLEVSFTVRGNHIHHSIAPLSLFPIVEQAFSQLPVQQPDEPGWVSVDLAVGDTYLALKVIHGQVVNQTNEAVWLADVQKQLHFHYAEAYDLQVRPEPDAHIVSLTLPLAILSQPD